MCDFLVLAQRLFVEERTRLEMERDAESSIVVALKEQLVKKGTGDRSEPLGQSQRELLVQVCHEYEGKMMSLLQMQADDAAIISSLRAMLSRKHAISSNLVSSIVCKKKDNHIFTS